MGKRRLAAYALRRVMLLIPLVFLVTIVVFLFTSLVPGGPVAALLGGRPTNAETIAAIRSRYHLDDPVHVQYLAWLGKVLHGDLGTSIYTGQPVATALGQRLRVTLELNVIAIVLSLTLGTALGMWAAVSRGGLADHVAVATGIFSSSLPSFVLAILLMYLLAIRIPLFPVSGLGRGGMDEVVHQIGRAHV